MINQTVSSLAKKGCVSKLNFSQTKNMTQKYTTVDLTELYFVGVKAEYAVAPERVPDTVYTLYENFLRFSEEYHCQALMNNKQLSIHFYKSTPSNICLSKADEEVLLEIGYFIDANAYDMWKKIICSDNSFNVKFLHFDDGKYAKLTHTGKYEHVMQSWKEFAKQLKQDNVKILDTQYQTIQA